MGRIRSASRATLWRAQYTFDAGDWRLWARTGGLWPAIRPIWRSAVPRRIWVRRRLGFATASVGQQWGGQQQRQLSQQDVNEVVRQLVPVLPQILAQAQQPYGAIGHAAFGQAPRQLS